MLHWGQASTRLPATTRGHGSEFAQVLITAVVLGLTTSFYTFTEVRSNVVDTKPLALDGPRGTGPGHPLFNVRERHDADGAVRMTLTGELDLSAAPGLKVRLHEVQRCEQRVRLDLSELEFIDCSGIRTILDAMAEARNGGGALEVDRSVSPIVGRIVSLGAIAGELWPAQATGQPGSAVAA